MQNWLRNRKTQDFLSTWVEIYTFQILECSNMNTLKRGGISWICTYCVLGNT